MSSVDGAACCTLTATPATLTTPLRAAVPVLVRIVYVACPDPEPDPVIAIHGAALEDVHVHPASVVTVIRPVAAAADTETVNGLTVNVHVAAGSVTVKVRPAIVSVAALDVDEVFGAAVNATVPDPVPVAPLVIVTQDALLADVHVQPAAVVTATVPLPPFDGREALVGEIEYEHSVAACVTLNVLSPMDSVPVRLAPELAATA